MTSIHPLKGCLRFQAISIFFHCGLLIQQPQYCLIFQFPLSITAQQLAAGDYTKPQVYKSCPIFYNRMVSQGLEECCEEILFLQEYVTHCLYGFENNINLSKSYTVLAQNSLIEQAQECLIRIENRVKDNVYLFPRIPFIYPFLLRRYSCTHTHFLCQYHLQKSLCMSYSSKFSQKLKTRPFL